MIKPLATIQGQHWSTLFYQPSNNMFILTSIATNILIDDNSCAVHCAYGAECI